VADYPLVPRFRDLDFHGLEMDALADAIEQRLAQPWQRARDKEEDPILNEKFRVFLRRGGDEPGLLLFLATLDSMVYVSNIVPTEKSELSRNEYNAALSEFYEEYALPAAGALGGEARLGGDVIDLQADLGETAFGALVAFSRSANRSTGSSHPMDRERWFAFLVAVHRSDAYLSVDVLAKWLVLDGWSESVASDLAIEFETGRDLLAYAERH
jgi:hypothetical protein